MEIDLFGATLAKYGMKAGAGVPCSYFTSLVNYMEADGSLDYVSSTSEGEAVAIAAGMVSAGKPAFALMQNSGLGNAVNPITSMLYIYQMPVALFISHRGEPGGKPDEPQHELMGQITEQLSKLCGMETHVLSDLNLEPTLADMSKRQIPAAWVVREGTIKGGPKAKPIKLEVEVGAIQLPARRKLSPTLGREAALNAILPILNAGGEASKMPAVIATTGKLSRELFELDDKAHDKPNRFYMVGSMGCAAGFGLGVARAKPNRKVLVLDGDGAILMKLGSLATIGDKKQGNLHHVVFDNGAHDTTGGQRTASPSVDFATMALAAGYRRADTVADERELVSTLKDHLGSEGPTFLRVLVQPGARNDLGRPTITPKQVYARFRGFLTQE
ncbi:MAG: phosphonopyruvate decarboxylase [Myxococcota bacterium]